MSGIDASACLHPVPRLAPGVRAAMSTRRGGVSPSPWESLNLGYATGDALERVAENERRFAAAFGVEPAAIRWVRQVHGDGVALAEELPATVGRGAEIPADAVISRTSGLACAIKVADCVPVLLAAEDASVVAAVHAGWRGVAAAIVPKTVRAMATSVPVRAWIGPAISRAAFEIGAEVHEALMQAGAKDEDFSVPYLREGQMRCHADLKAIIVRQLLGVGLERQHIHVDPACTYAGRADFFSHRRDGPSGRMAAMIMIENPAGHGYRA